MNSPTNIKMLQPLSEIKTEMQSYDKLPEMLTKIKEEIKVENLEVAEDILLSDNYFVDSSKAPDCESDNTFGNFSVEKDPLSLNETSDKDIKKVVLIVKPLKKADISSKSAINCGSSTTNAIRSNEFDKKIFVCQGCKTKDRKRNKCENEIEVERTYKKFQNFKEIETIKPSNEQRYPCKFCSSVSKSPRLYMLHLAKHGKELHECYYCFKNLKVKWFLRPLTTDVNKYLCELCGKTLNRKCSYVAHMANHYRKQCRFCSKMFPKFKELMVHSEWCKVRTVCSGCSKNFATVEAVKNHRLICEGIQKLNR